MWTTHFRPKLDANMIQSSAEYIIIIIIIISIYSYIMYIDGQ